VQKLTQRQAQVLEFIEKQIRQAGYPPTLREIGDELGIRSTNGVNDHLKALEKKGYLGRQGNRSRALTLIRPQDGGATVSPLHPHLAERKPVAQNRRSPNVIPAALPSSDTIEVPLLGRVAAGEPILAEEHAEGTVTVDRFLVGGDAPVYALRVVGESMIEDGIFDGDFLFVRKQAHADRGAVVVAMIDGEATVKRFYPEADRVRFQPANQELAPIIVPKSAFRETQILGTVVGVYRKL
jgi:repressor LexA